MTDLERRALLGDRQAQEECTEKGIMLPCPWCGCNGKVSFKNHRFCGQNYLGSKRIVYRIQVICNKCRSRGKPIFTEPLINPNPYITKWGNHYAETEACKKETERFLPYVLNAVDGWNTRPAPPIGRCEECVHWYKNHCAHGPCATEPTDADFFCGSFKPKGSARMDGEHQCK